MTRIGAAACAKHGKLDGVKKPLQFIAPMEARLVEELPTGTGWQYEPKWDGFRALALRAGDEVALYAKSGKPLSRYFPDAIALLRSLPQRRFVLDGELVIPQGAGYSFDALQMRLHPAESRVRKLAAESPARYVVFDLLASATTQLASQPLRARRAALEKFAAAAGRGKRQGAKGAAPTASLMLSPMTRDVKVARRWLADTDGALDGVIAKRLEDIYAPGERAVLKIKNLRTADCVVGGFRYASGTRQVGSLLLGLYDDEGKLHHVGFTSGIAAAERGPLTRRLQPLRKAPGFTGRAPGGPSRWSTERSAEWVPLRPELVVEVRYDHVTDDRFRHGTRLMRWRPDKAPRQCTFEQLRAPARTRRKPR